MKLLTKRLKITEVQIGDYIRSRDITNGIDEFNLVKNTMTPIVPKASQLEICLSNGTSVVTSTIHPTLVYRNKAWIYVDASELTIGDICYSFVGSSEIISILPADKDENFADFSVEKTENYYAGSSADKMMVVHNSATLFYPAWHLELEDLLVLKNNKGTEENRVRHMDYGVQFNKLMYERLLSGGDITLFSPSDVPGLYDAFFQDQDLFKKLYETAERNTRIRKKSIPAAELFGQFMQERKDTGRIYSMNVDHANSHSPFDPKIHPIKMSNLCVEVLQSTVPLNDINDPEGRIALCSLSAINWGKIKKPSDFAKPCELAIRGLDELLDYQRYPVLAAHMHTKEFRPLGVGLINFAYWLAKNDSTYQDPNLELVDEYAEAWSYYLIKASADLAKEKGPAEVSSVTKYGNGITPNQTYKKDVDDLVAHQERLPWDELRQQLKEFGIRNTTVTCLMPSESSSQIANATNGIEPPRGFVSVKRSKDGVLKQVVPGYPRLKNKYDLLWNQLSPVGYLKICAVLQKYVDQSISANTSYNPAHYEDGKVPMSEMLMHLLLAYKYGLKTLYYCNTNDGAGEISTDAVADNNNTIIQTDDDEEVCDSCVI
jgi:ribonucleoside-diphosphate reductase alpha chain